MVSGRMAAGLAAIALGAFRIGWASSEAHPAALACEGLAAIPVLSHPPIKSGTSAAAQTNTGVDYCLVTLVYPGCLSRYAGPVQARSTGNLAYQEGSGILPAGYVSQGKGQGK